MQLSSATNTLQTGTHLCCNDRLGVLNRRLQLQQLCTSTQARTRRHNTTLIVSATTPHHTETRRRLQSTTDEHAVASAFGQRPARRRHSEGGSGDGHPMSDTSPRRQQHPTAETATAPPAMQHNDNTLYCSAAARCHSRRRCSPDNPACEQWGTDDGRGSARGRAGPWHDAQYAVGCIPRAQSATAHGTAHCCTHCRFKTHHPAGGSSRCSSAGWRCSW